MQPNYCPVCNTERKHVPAGYSKTKLDQYGNPKAYNAFWACPNKCKEPRANNSQQRSLPTFQAPTAQVITSPSLTPIREAAADAISRGIVRMEDPVVLASKIIEGSEKLVDYYLYGAPMAGSSNEETEDIEPSDLPF